MPERVQLSRRKGSRLPPNTVNVARPGMWGNPFIPGEASGVFNDGGPILVPALTLEQCIDFYRRAVGGMLSPEMHPAGHEWFKRFRKRNGHPGECVWGLRGFNLACWCALDQPCHADVLLALANPPPSTSGSEEKR